MATVLVDLIPDTAPLKVYLYSIDSATTGTPNVSGYLLTSTTNNWEYSATITGLVGKFRMEIIDDDGMVIGILYIKMVDNTSTVRPVFEAGSLDSASVDIVSELNGTTWTDEDGNSFDLTITST